MQLAATCVCEDTKMASPDLKNFKQKCIYACKSITVEPAIGLYLFATNLSLTAIALLPFEMACWVNARFNDTVCNSYATGTLEEKGFTREGAIVQRYVSDVSSWSSLGEKVVPVILLLFVGTFSDKHKIRKPFILILIFGEIIAAGLCMLCIINRTKWSVEVQKVAQEIIPSFFGSYSVLTMAFFSYIIDISTPEDCIIRLAMVELIIIVCDTAGNAFSGLFFEATGSIPCLAFGLVLFICAFVYGLFMIKEPRQSGELINARLIADMFNPQHVIESVKMFTKSSGVQRVNFIFIMFIAFLNVLIAGEINVFSNFTVQVYNWTEPMSAYYNAANSAINCLGLAIGIPILSKMLGLNNLLMILVAYFDKIISNIISITIKSTCGLYMALLAGILVSINGAATRSQSARYVSKEDMGKTQSLLCIVAAIGDAIATEIYHQGLWVHTVDTHPHALFYLAIGICAFAAITVIFKYTKEKNQVSCTLPTIGKSIETTKI